MTDLIARLEAAEAGSQEMSARIIHAFRAPDGTVEQSTINGRWCVYDKNGRLLENSGRNGWWREGGWEVTESIDAALALASRVLKIGAWDVGYAYSSEPPHYARLVIVRDDEGQPEVYGRASTPALALCAAILRAQSEARV